MTPEHNTLREEFVKEILEVKIGTDWGICPSQIEAIERFMFNKLDQALENQREEIRMEIENHQFKMHISDYLPKVKAWAGGYDRPFDDGYAQAREDIIKLLQAHTSTSNEEDK